MRHGLLFVLLLSAASAAGGQARPWAAPRAADGHPDLQGLWENNSATPLERPAVFADKPRLTQPELDALKAQAARLFSGDADAVFGDAFYLGILENINRGLGATNGSRVLQMVLTKNPAFSASTTRLQVRRTFSKEKSTIFV